MDSLLFKDLTHEIIGSAVQVHWHLGPGLLEGTYRACLLHELSLRGLATTSEESVALAYKGLNIEHAFRTDLVVQNTVVLELKCVREIETIHEAQLLTYMRLRKLPVGLLFNFRVTSLRHGFRRFVR